MGKRILIISYFFAPQNAMGAVRPTKLAKYLSRMGHEVTVLCGPGMNDRRDPTLARDLTALREVHVIREWNPLRDRRARPATASAATRQAEAQPPAAASRAGALHAVKDAVYRWLRWQADRSFRRRAVAALDGLTGTYDVVFSTYAPWSVHEIAREAKRRGLARRWIADFRDEVGTAFAWQKGQKARYLRMLRREADVLCAASQGFLEMMGFEDIGRVLSNGFDREDLPTAADAPARTGKLRVVYCGMLSMGRKGVGDRDLTDVSRAVHADQARTAGAQPGGAGVRGRRKRPDAPPGRRVRHGGPGGRPWPGFARAIHRPATGRGRAADGLVALGRPARDSDGQAV